MNITLRESTGISLLLHMSAVSLLFWLASSEALRPARQLEPILRHRLIDPYRRTPGGGGGQNSPIPASRGRLPQRALRQFTPLLIETLNQNPRLVAVPAVIAPPDIEVPQVNLENFGNPFAREGPLSGGPGGPDGVGAGRKGGVGEDEGPGFGQRGKPASASVVRGETRLPALLFKIEPEFSEEARKAKLQGTVVLVIEVDVTGLPRNIRVTQGLGLGLDEQAIAAVHKWRFRPGTRNGKPTVMPATVEVNFRLL